MAIFQLHELRVHIDDVITEIDAGDYDEDGDLAYEVAIGHLLDHLALAWHYARMSNEKIDSKTQAQFELLTNSIPDLNTGRQLVNPFEDVI